MSQHPYGPVPTTAPAWEPGTAQTQRNVSRLLGAVAVALAALALVVAVAAWFRAAPKPVAAPVYSQQQVDDAKKAVCEAFERGVKTLEIAGNRTGDSPVEADVVAVNTRLALASVSSYLTNELATNLAAAPPELVDDVRQLSMLYQDIEMAQLADATKEDVAPAAKSADTTASKIRKLCS